MDDEIPTPEEAAADLFGPSLYPQYQSFRNGTSAYPDSLPSAQTYAAFMSHLHTSGKLYTLHSPDPSAPNPQTSNLRTSNICGHATHPANPIHTFDVCPVCIVKSNIDALDRIWSLWHVLGGPSKRPRHEGTHHWMWYTVRKIYYVEKLRWARLVFSFEESAENEGEWEREWENGREAEGLEREELERAIKCEDAVRIARDECPYLLDEQSAIHVPGTSSPGSVGHLSSSQSSYPSSPPPYPSRQRTRKTVAFDTGSIPPENPPRSRANFRRHAENYKPGRHACPSKEGWDDTSFANDATYDEYEVEEEAEAESQDEDEHTEDHNYNKENRQQPQEKSQASNTQNTSHAQQGRLDGSGSSSITAAMGIGHEGSQSLADSPIHDRDEGDHQTLKRKPDRPIEQHNHEDSVSEPERRPISDKRRRT